MNIAVIKRFKPINLQALNQVKLMKRTDRKFLVPRSLVSDIFKAISNDYYVLEINSERLHGYQTVYYDTSDNQMYKCHHNGKLNRYKVRKRIYIETRLSFLEIKFKNNKGKTIKERIASDNQLYSLSKEELEYLNARIPFDANLLIPKISNRFYRMTLANKTFNERCTIDFDVNFSSNGQFHAFKDIVIIEVKQDGNKTHSPLIETLKKSHISASGFSKYCMGRAVTDDTLKQNAFKVKLRQVNKLLS